MPDYDYRGTILGEGADNAEVISTSEIPIRAEVIDMCKQNRCGKYGKCWMCPPLIGNFDETSQRALEFSHICVFNKVYRLEDSFDIEGMTRGRADFGELVGRIKSKLGDGDMILGCGGCGVCTKCAAEDNAECRFPDKAYSSLEGYGIQVSELASACGIKYINGENTVTYFGGVLFGKCDT